MKLDSNELLPPLPETLKMRNLSTRKRNEAIEQGENVVDLRPTLKDKADQRRLAAKYRKGTPPDGDGPSYA